MTRSTPATPYRLLPAAGLTLLVILACNLPSARTPAQADLAGTITAQAVELQTARNTPALTLTATATGTSTPSVPVVRVTSATNCRTGPGTAYDVVFTMQAGATAQVVGRDSADNYWVINNPSGGTCWLWGKFAFVSGNWLSLPEYPAPATLTPSAPLAPEDFKGSVTCSPSTKPYTEDVHVILSWSDLATNEAGYHIFRSGELLVTLKANSTTYTDDTTFSLLVNVGKTPPPPPTVIYDIEAFNSTGLSSRREVMLGCP